GANSVLWGVFSTSSLTVVNSTIQNFFGNRSAPGNGVRHSPRDQNSKLVVLNSIIKDINSFEDGTVGNYVGATRGILSSGGDVRIVNTSFLNIQGEEDADCIHIQTVRANGIVWAPAGSVVIENCS